MFSSAARVNNPPLLPLHNFPSVEYPLQEIRAINLVSSESTNCPPINPSSSEAQLISSQISPQKKKLNFDNFFDLEIPDIKYDIYKYLSFSERLCLSQANKACYSFYRETLNISGQFRDEWIKFIFSAAEKELKVIQNNIAINSPAIMDLYIYLYIARYNINSNVIFYKTTQKNFLSFTREVSDILKLYHEKWQSGHLELTESERGKLISVDIEEKFINLKQQFSECREILSCARLRIMSPPPQNWVKKTDSRCTLAILSIFTAIYFYLDWKTITDGSRKAWIVGWVIFSIQLLFLLIISPAIIKMVREAFPARHIPDKDALHFIDTIEKNLLIVEKYHSKIPFILNSASYTAIYGLSSSNHQTQQSAEIENRNKTQACIYKANLELKKLTDTLRNIEHTPLDVNYRLA